MLLFLKHSSFLCNSSSVPPEVSRKRTVEQDRGSLGDVFVREGPSLDPEGWRELLPDTVVARGCCRTEMKEQEVSALLCFGFWWRKTGYIPIQLIPAVGWSS